MKIFEKHHIHYYRVVAYRRQIREIFAPREEEREILGRKVFGEDSRIFQIPDKFYGPPRGRFTSGYERSSEPMLTRTKDIYYPRVCTVYIYTTHHTRIHTHTQRSTDARMCTVNTLRGCVCVSIIKLSTYI